MLTSPQLGFLLEFISLPILNGFITAVAITIILNQMDSLLGESNIGDGTATQVSLHQVKPLLVYAPPNCCRYTTSSQSYQTPMPTLAP